MRTVFSAALLAIACAAAPAAPATKPNVVFICTDQQRIDDMSAAGNPYVKTPALDALAQRGVRFTRSYCTQPLCSPSRATHVSSRMPYEVGVANNSLRLPASLPTMGTLFKEAGYKTVWTGKWHLPSSYPSAADAEIPGFDVLPRTADVPPRGARSGKRAKAQTKSTAEADEEAGGRGSQADPGTLRAALEFLRAKPQQPFLLTVSLLNPHDICGFNPATPTRLALPSDLEKLPPLPLNLNAADLGQASAGANARRQNKQHGDLDWSDLVWRQQLYYYYRLTERVDGLIGQLLSELQKAGLQENTVVLFTSDHGEMGGGHHRIRKMSLYDEAMTVPFIVAGPGVPKGITDKTHLVSGLDVLPTLCDFAGIAPPAQARGLSMRKLLQDPQAPWRQAVFGNLGASAGRMVRTDRYKYNVYPGNREELFDLANDPGETNNLARQPSSAPLLEQHRKLLREWMDKTEDPYRQQTGTTTSAGENRKRRI